MEFRTTKKDLLIKKYKSLYLIIFFIFYVLSAYGDIDFEESQIKKELQQIQSNNRISHQLDIIVSLQSALDFITESKASIQKIKEYQKIIENFPILIKQIQEEKKLKNTYYNDVVIKFSAKEVNQELLKANNRLIILVNQLKQEQEQARVIADSVMILPHQQAEARKELNNIDNYIHVISKPNSLIEKAQFTNLRMQRIAKRLKIEELDLAQLSVNYRQELSKIRIDLLKSKYNKIDQELQILKNNLYNLRKQESEKALHDAEKSSKEIDAFPQIVIIQFKKNHDLSLALNQQSQEMDSIAFKQRQSTKDILQVRHALSTLIEQSQWLDESPILGETLRSQMSKLPEVPKSQQLNTNMVQIRVQRLYFEDLINKLLSEESNKKKIKFILTKDQFKIFEEQLLIQRDLLDSLLIGCDTQILELTKLKALYGQLEEAIKEVKEASHKYLFWVADTNSLTPSFILSVIQDLKKMFNRYMLSQIFNAMKTILTSRNTLLLLFSAFLFWGFMFSSRKHYLSFLNRSSIQVGKVNQDRFSITLKNVFWSMLVAAPFPILWISLGYGFSHAWAYPISVALGEAMISTSFILWVLLLCASFALPKGLFVIHFGWKVEQIRCALRYYTLSITTIIPLITILITINNYSDREFTSSIGRLCFILICIGLSLVTNSFKRAGLLLYLDKIGSNNNIINRSFWNFMICAPILAIISASLGYFSTAQVLLTRLETSLTIWLFLLIIYHIIRRWMFIQRRRIAFERAKQRRAEMLAQRARNTDEQMLSPSQLNEVAAEVDNKILDLDTISAKSLQLVRSILTLMALLSVILLWSELHSAFSFLENITLWDSASTLKGIDNLKPITLNSIFIVILILIITTQMVRNLPALLELALLQHLNLTPGTGYAITTLTKYGLMLLGGLIGFSIVGMEWSKFQWLAAALGVGLGFGLQEIFANFVSGLIILFEKPIRIGDTVTIRSLTGSITKINTRATTITDWDRKEIIVPNKAFITEQFVNWSLSDTVTRVVLHVPAPAESNIEKISNILVQAAIRCPLVLDFPIPEAFLVDIQKGLPLFELRIYAAEMSHRMPLRHQVNKLILDCYREHGIQLPYPPFQLIHEYK
ncbi:putative mechanosensitive channel [Wigglesworthia glossinidia endosymbiont of Glossina morsitans morsitans (Yale colony)]|uniref:Putative mechanosensitive channel n=1 Tax=Wigglesworthia glossinidia endosymbiont of Glossina morsitans morsitans (Yale colony) TaxID=1142511 RepID=H6Q5X3_WIGGL|nr:miniconductance mechanosensitive channel MscM [Wigglesworthia glossinidia]AFA41169.1 putative mechanosensitive channel [Wigglesworthia glossinidia endosymbiont of Glossina morsitans morsitans (Yale colony)]